MLFLDTRSSKVARLAALLEAWGQQGSRAQVACLPRPTGNRRKLIRFRGLREVQLGRDDAISPK